jgi:hypothetical protein
MRKVHYRLYYFENSYQYCIIRSLSGPTETYLMDTCVVCKLYGLR